MAAKRPDAVLILHKKACMLPEVTSAIERMASDGVRIAVRIPWDRDDGRSMIQDAVKTGIRRIIVGGGDGTLNDTVNTIMALEAASEISLGVLPLGTANDFARGAGLPLGDPVEALRIAAAGEATPIDIGEANGRYFINVASGGFGAEVTATTPQDLKKALGGAAYTLVGLVRMLRVEPYLGRIIFADGTEQDWEMVFMAVGNNRYAGGAFEVAPRARLTDGLLDLAALAPVRAADFGEVAYELLDQFNEANKFLFYRQLESFVIESDRPLHMNLDGEPMIDRRFEFKTHPRVLPVVLGAEPHI